MVFKVEKYVCDTCLNEYLTEEEAINCESLWMERILNVEGAIVDYFYEGIPDLYDNNNNNISIFDMKVVAVYLRGHFTHYSLSEKIGENKWNTFPSLEIESTVDFEKYCIVKENPNTHSNLVDETRW